MFVNKNIRKFGSPTIFIVDLNIVMSCISYKAFGLQQYIVSTPKPIRFASNILYNLWLAMSICAYLIQSMACSVEFLNLYIP